jgi:dTDP-glucose pyrophosphorylase
MDAWQKLLISSDTSIRDAISVIDQASLQHCLVVDAQRTLMGVVSDGDVRRGILRGVDIDGSVATVMNDNPVTAEAGLSRDAYLNVFYGKSVRLLPLVDSENCVVDVLVLDQLTAETPRYDNWIVIMAGGLGQRLRPRTLNTPKPLLKVGDRPIVETIVTELASQGFRNFYISVNFQADKLREHLGDGNRWNVNINYIDESEPMGTAGSLTLLEDKPTSPLIVMNGDLLTKLNFVGLLDLHNENKATGTVWLREYDFQIPFGVVKTEDLRVVELDEKPLHRFMVNAGIYVLNPEVVDMIPANVRVDMTDVFQDLLRRDETVIGCPIHEYWIDIGREEDFLRANDDYSSLFPRPESGE